MSINRRANEILDDVGRIIRQRGEAYGDALLQHGVLAKLWATYLGRDVNSADVSVMLALLKVSRIISSDEPSADTYADMIGYAALAAASAEEARDNG